jgi:hypothetical protein
MGYPDRWELGLFVQLGPTGAARQRPFRSSRAKLALFRAMGPTGTGGAGSHAVPRPLPSVRKLALFCQGRSHVQSTIILFLQSTCPSCPPAENWVCFAQKAGDWNTGMMEWWGIPTGGNWVCLVRSTFRHSHPRLCLRSVQLDAAGLHVFSLSGGYRGSGGRLRRERPCFYKKTPLNACMFHKNQHFGRNSHAGTNRAQRVPRPQPKRVIHRFHRLSQISKDRLQSKGRESTTAHLFPPS